jgi:hypothetical protein
MAETAYQGSGFQLWTQLPRCPLVKVLFLELRRVFKLTKSFGKNG